MESEVALITGATGYIGSNLARRLVKENWCVHAIIRANSALNLIEDIKDNLILHIYDGSTSSLIEIVSKSKPEVVFHLASLFLAQHQSTDINRLIESNILFGTQLLEAMKVNGVTKLINTGTSWQHYENEDYNPVCLYAATKQAYEAMIEYYVKVENFKVITLKLFDTYGPRDPRQKLFNLLNKVARDNITLSMSPGEQLIDLVYIDDVIDAYLAAMSILNIEENKHLRFMVSSRNLISLKKLVELYQNYVGKKISINWGGRAYRNREVMIPWNKGLMLQNWVPKVNLIEGIKKIIQ